ncbi:MAG: GIY-YIG nuclease family protein [Bacteroidota bacterium]
MVVIQSRDEDCWRTYLKCSDGTYYTGGTNNFERRLKEHKSGKHAGYSSMQLLVELVYSIEVEKPIEAIYLKKLN